MNWPTFSPFYVRGIVDVPRLGFDDAESLLAEQRAKLIYAQVGGLFDDIEEQLGRLRTLFDELNPDGEEEQHEPG